MNEFQQKVNLLEKKKKEEEEDAKKFKNSLAAVKKCTWPLTSILI